MVFNGVCMKIPSFFLQSKQPKRAAEKTKAHSAGNALAWHAWELFLRWYNPDQVKGSRNEDSYLSQPLLAPLACYLILNFIIARCLLTGKRSSGEKHFSFDSQGFDTLKYKLSVSE